MGTLKLTPSLTLKRFRNISTPKKESTGHHKNSQNFWRDRDCTRRNAVRRPFKEIYEIANMGNITSDD